MIRINALETPWGEADLAAAIAAAPDAILVPKVSSAETLAAVGLRLRKLRRRGAHPGLGHDRDAARDPAGGVDRERGARRRHAAVLLRHGHERSRQGHPRPPAAGPRRHAALADDARSPPRGRTASTFSTGSTTACPIADGFRAECEQGRDCGFDGKTLIHPDQIAAANEIFAPSDRRGGERPRHRRGLRAAGERGQGRDQPQRPHGRAAACGDGESARWRWRRRLEKGQPEASSRTAEPIRDRVQDGAHVPSPLRGGVGVGRGATG